MHSFRRLTTLLIALAALTLCGCDRDDQRLAAEQPQAPAAQRPVRVSVPDEVARSWRAVKIAVIDKMNGHEEVHTVEIGGSTALPEAGLILEVKTFLPSFIMEGTTITSAGNELRNPGALVAISQNGKKVFRGWLFSLFPIAHAFSHPRYSFTLVDFVPAE